MIKISEVQHDASGFPYHGDTFDVIYKFTGHLYLLKQVEAYAMQLGIPITSVSRANMLYVYCDDIEAMQIRAFANELFG